MDVTRPFPIDDGGFDYIYARHLIEYLELGAGRFMSGECFPVPGPGGTIRIVTTSITFLFGLFAPDRPAAADRFIRRTTETFVAAAPGDTPAPLSGLVFNHLIRGHGRRFIYDHATLELVLNAAGFSDVRPCEPDRSDHVSLPQLEAADPGDDGFAARASLILEAT